MVRTVRHASLIIVCVLVAAVLLACSDDSGSGSDTAADGADSGSGDGSTAIGPCATEDDAATSTTALPLSTTVAPAGQAAIDANTYGQEFPDSYAGAALVEGGNTVQVGFTDDVEEHQAALDEQLGAGAVEVVAMDHSLEELNELRSEVADQLVGDDVTLGAEINTRDNLVIVDVGEVNDESIAAVADAFPGEPLCVE